MKKYLVVLVALLLGTSLSAFADPPAQANNALIFKPVSCPFFVIVDPGPEIFPSLPGGYGILISNLNAEDGQLVVNSSGNGTLNCHAETEEGAIAEGTDTGNGNPDAEGTITPFNEACIAVNLAFPGVCKGDGTFVLQGKKLQINCNVAGALTPNWRQVTTQGGKMTRVCNLKN